jgi:UDPglucose 6-dehydrogenase
VLPSNEVHEQWIRAIVGGILDGVSAPVVAVLGLTYKPGTNELLGSSSLELCLRLHQAGVTVQAHDPSLTSLPAPFGDAVRLFGAPRQALAGSDLAILATAWPEYLELTASAFVDVMRRARVLDPLHLLAGRLRESSGVAYFAPGRSRMK